MEYSITRPGRPHPLTVLGLLLPLMTIAGGDASAQTNAELRQGKRVSVMFGLDARAIGGGMTAALGVHTRPNLLLEADVDVAGSLGPASIWSRWSVAVRALFFAGDTLHLSAGFRVMTGDHEEPNRTYRTLNLDVGVGNRWQWEYFSLGAEWIAASIPFLAFDGDCTGCELSRVQALDFRLVRFTLGFTI